jgi:polar amino acid transport system ATP-binding protein
MVTPALNLFPHMTAIENIIEAPVQVKGVRSRRDRQRPSTAEAGLTRGQDR